MSGICGQCRCETPNLYANVYTGWVGMCLACYEARREGITPDDADGPSAAGHEARGVG